MPRPAQPEDDFARIRAAQQGDASSFAALIDRHHGLVRALVARSGTARGEVEDLAQEAWLEAWRRLPSLRDPARWKGWIAEVALNVGRQRARRLRVEDAARPRLRARASGAAGDGRDPDPLEADEERSAVLEALDGLPEETRRLIVERYVEGRSAPEIAASEGIRADAVRARLARALRTVRERLAWLREGEREERSPGRGAELGRGGPAGGRRGEAAASEAAASEAGDSSRSAGL